jgi:type VI secretion system secreted protein VgrG
VATTQAERPLTLTTPLGKDVLMCTAISGTEAMSQLFSFEVECVSEKPDQVKLDKLLGQPAQVTVLLKEGERHFHGIVNRAVCTGRDIGDQERYTHYRLEVVPWLWLLTRTNSSRIFQNKSIRDILQEVLKEHGAGELQLQLKGTYDPVDYCVQYRESDFDFVSRLMEEEGIFYFFKHEDGKHTLVLGDTPDANKPCPGQSKAVFEPEGGSGEREDVVTSWTEQQVYRTGKWTTWDHNFQMPDKNLEASATTRIKVGGNDAYEIYDYPGRYAQRFNKPDERMGDVEKQGRTFIKLRMEAEEAQQTTISGASLVRAFAPGFHFELDKPPQGVSSGPYVLTQVRHSARQAAYISGQEDFRYENDFLCIPHSVPFRAPRQTPKPIVHGSQTAIVVGPPGEEIYPDKYGRVKVQFPWDRNGKRNQDSSLWVRVSQIHAGKGFGAISIPRIGEEVVVAFMEGDPDQPIIVGRVYHAANMPPFTLPDSKNISGMKTNSTKGGGGYNEMVMDDTKDKELIRIHAQYDMDTTVEHDDRQTVHNDRTITVNGKHTEKIKKDTSIKILEGPYEHKVLDNTSTAYVKGDVTEDYDANQTTNVKKTIATTSTEANIVLTAATEIKLVTGASSLTMKKDGTIELIGKDIKLVASAELKISGPKIGLAGTQEAKMGVGTQSMTCNTMKLEAAGAAITSAAVGVHEISGAVVKLN